MGDRRGLHIDSSILDSTFGNRRRRHGHKRQHSGGGARKCFKGCAPNRCTCFPIARECFRGCPKNKCICYPVLPLGEPPMKFPCKEKKCKPEKCVTSATSSCEIWCNMPILCKGDDCKKCEGRGCKAGGEINYGNCCDSSSSSLCGWGGACGGRTGGYNCKTCGNGGGGCNQAGCVTNRGGDGGKCGGKCNTICYKRCDSHPASQLECQVVRGAKYELVNCVPRNIGKVPCSPCGPCYSAIGSCQPAV